MRGLDRKRRWMLVAGAASLVASQLAERAVYHSWRFATDKEPPEDPLYKDVSWKTALTFSAVLGAAVALSEVLGRHTAAVAWKRTTGAHPPQPRRRPRTN